MSPRLADLTDHARSLTSAGDLAGARAVLTDALAPVDADPTRASPELADAATLLARLLVMLSEPAAARGWADFAQTAQHRLHGPHDERTLAATATHAAVLHRIGQHAPAARLYQDIVDRLTDTDGPSSARVLAAEADLAIAEHAAGHCVTARARLADAWRRHNEEYGDASPAGIKMLARLGAMERDCGLDGPAHEHLSFAQELCARYLTGDNLLTVQVAALARAQRSGAHVCRRGTAPPQVAPGVTGVPRPREGGVTALREPDDDGYEWPPDGMSRDGGYGTAVARTESDRLLPVHLPRPQRVTSRRPVVVAGVVTIGLVATAGVAAAALSSRGDRGTVAAPTTGAAPPGSATSARPGAPPPGAPATRTPATRTPATRTPATRTPAAGAPPPRTAASGSVPSTGVRSGSTGARPAPGRRAAPTGLVITDAAGGVTLQWRYPVRAEGPVLISGGRTGQSRQAFQQLSAGSTSYVVYGLNERVDYCFTVSVVYSVDDVAESEPVCTDRG